MFTTFLCSTHWNNSSVTSFNRKIDRYIAAHLFCFCIKYCRQHFYLLPPSKLTCLTKHVPSFGRCYMTLIFSEILYDFWSCWYGLIWFLIFQWFYMIFDFSKIWCDVEAFSMLSFFLLSKLNKATSRPSNQRNKKQFVHMSSRSKKKNTWNAL